jgi:hypothetical protein
VIPRGWLFRTTEETAPLLRSLHKIDCKALVRGTPRCAKPLRALAAYKDFLTLWKDADLDVPILERGQGGAREAALLSCAA